MGDYFQADEWYDHAIYEWKNDFDYEDENFLPNEYYEWLLSEEEQYIQQLKYKADDNTKSNTK